MDHYRKIEGRTNNQLTFLDPPITEKVGIVLEMQSILSRWGIQLNLCCEKEVLAALPPASPIGPAACISGERIMAVHGGRVSLARDSGQRRSSGCGCSISVDVGSYNLHPCHHNCLFCYANPACDQRRRQ
jgi:predicted metalloprotease with PDZ domain